MAATTSTSNTSISATCVCKKNNLSVSFPSSSLPIDRAFCLCTTCRRLTGSCGISSIKLPPTANVDLSTLSLTAYSTSDDLTRYFCSTCGAHFICYRKSDQTWHLMTGLWDKTEDVIRWTGCKWVEDTLDGGMGVWLREIEDEDGTRRPLKSWKLQDGPDGEFLDAKSLSQSFKPPTIKGYEDDKLSGQCYCGGVEFFITRPNESSKHASSNFADVIVPYNSNTPSANPNCEPWWLSSCGTRYAAGLCTCDSCRRASGMEIQSWAFIPQTNISQIDGSPLDFNMGTLKQYKSRVAEGVYREFCGVCGAACFWHNEVRRNLVDVAVGVLDPQMGARCEGWLKWFSQRVSFAEEAVSKRLVTSLSEGLKLWQTEENSKKGL